MNDPESTTGLWMWSAQHRQACQVLETRSLWGATTCRVWLPNSDSVVRVPYAQLEQLTAAAACTRDGIGYIAAAARVADAMTQDVLLAPIESSVIPLPHQIQALSRAISQDRVRYLLADEVGLGKTIEAGLIMRELKLRGLVTRTLVIAPKGLVTQWVAEMRIHFGEDFRLLVPGDFTAYRRFAQEENLWRSHDQIVCPMDSVKPMDSRRGWSRDQVAEYNRERFEDLISVGWDLVIVDESHRLGGSTDQVARYKLGRGLSEAAPYLLLLSATPHQGKTDAFHRLLSLIDEGAFPDVESVTRERVQPVVIRTEKRHAIDAEGKPLFKPRHTQLITVSWEERHQRQRHLYEAMTEYVREGYNKAMQEKRSYIGFLMILMQRLVVSSTRAIRTTLERRLEALDAPEEQLTLFPMHLEDEWADLDGQEQIETLLKTRLKALKDERSEVKLLLEATRQCDEAGSDAKAEALLEWIYRLQQEEGDPDLKILIFTEFVPTQTMLEEFLTDRGFAVTCLNGSMGMDERRRAQDIFAERARILVSTDAGGEGLNLQFCHVVINYDIPWNPMRLEQRIGRVDRIGQTHVVRAVNFVFADSVEHRVREVLEQKLAIILDEFGIDKTGDVLDSAQAGRIFDDLHVDAILHPEAIEATVDAVVNQIQEQAKEAQEQVKVLGTAETLDPGEAQRLMTHPLPHWVERMTISYIRAHGGQVKRRGRVWDLTWPDGEDLPNVVFTARDAASAPTAHHLTLEEPRIRRLATCLPWFVPGQPTPSVSLSGLSPNVKGTWSLWRITIRTGESSHERIMPLFLHDDGRCLAPTARHIWDQLLASLPDVCGHTDTDETHVLHERLLDVAEEQGKPFYDALLQSHHDRLDREREKGKYAFMSRRRAVDRIGLPAVRSHRLVLLEQEERAWLEQLNRREQVSPEMVLLLALRLHGGASNA